jgi:hypothetical protein
MGIKLRKLSNESKVAGEKLMMDILFEADMRNVNRRRWIRRASASEHSQWRG